MARQRSLIDDAKHRGIFVRVIDTIKNTLETTECYYITWYDSLPEPVIKMLQDEGYRVKGSSFRNETQYTISWKWE